MSIENGTQRGESKPLEVYYPRTRAMAAKKDVSGNLKMDSTGEAYACTETLRYICCLGKLKMSLCLDPPF